MDEINHWQCNRSNETRCRVEAVAGRWHYHTVLENTVLVPGSARMVSAITRAHA